MARTANSNPKPKKAPKSRAKTKSSPKTATKTVKEPEAEPNPVGRPSEYDEDYVRQAEKLCDLGATDEEIAEFFDVSVRTIYRWKLDHPEFCQALKAGKEKADERVERSLYQKATGFFFTEQQAFKLKAGDDKEEVEVVDVEKYQASDTTAAIFWLKNRRPADWRDKQELELNVSDDIAEMLDARRKRAKAAKSG